MYLKRFTLPIEKEADLLCARAEHNGGPKYGYIDNPYPCGLFSELGFGEALISSVGVGLGFMAAMTVFASLRERVEDEFVPAAFRGLPVSLLIAAMMSLVLFAF